MTTFSRYQITSICREREARDGFPRNVEEMALTVFLWVQEHHRTSGKNKTGKMVIRLTIKLLAYFFWFTLRHSWVNLHYHFQGKKKRLSVSDKVLSIIRTGVVRNACNISVQKSHGKTVFHTAKCRLELPAFKTLGIQIRLWAYYLLRPCSDEETAMLLGSGRKRSWSTAGKLSVFGCID